MSKSIYLVIISELKAWFEAIFIKNIPGRVGFLIRRLYWYIHFHSMVHFEPGCVITSHRNIKIGYGVTFNEGCRLYAHENGKIIIGNDLHVNNNVIFGASEDGEIVIGDSILIGPNVVIRASEHSYERLDIPISSQGHKGGRIVIEDGVWIGANSVILSDVRIGVGAIIGAGSVVINDIPANCMAAGVPAVVKIEAIRK